ncbi:GNAT family N-acetyltransferase [Pseudaminobacter soli (ex Li et al. 2025)]|uniref:30S ribosomal protein S5 alanine N-acetyltransferase n=1 Tax=Pseudaminobacter soli (ex Li et al. 2025) TaxID=1295366 RepID=A0A2P7SG02_9HYPH|nr:GNAT family protein [Mesorhizobium soli]PSJ61426.1 30S ribosomal protein S5 alanine N-acetyltransferase [Mesorhizobium soli]
MFALSFFRRDAPALKGERVYLRAPEAGDYHEWASLRGESRAFLEPWEPRWAADELDRSAWRQRLGRYREDFANGNAAAFFIFENATNRLVGGITLGNIRHGVAQSGQIGYWMGQRYAGQGLMLEALLLLTDFGFDTLRLHRIEAACIPGNKRSVRVLEKAGFQREGLLRSYLRINGNWQDHHLYALIADDRRGGTTKG